MSTIRFIRDYYKDNAGYYLFEVKLPFRGEIKNLSGNLQSRFTTGGLLRHYLDFIKPKGEDWVEDIRLRSDSSTDRAGAGLAHALDTTWLAVAEDGEVAASYTIYGSVEDRQAGIVCHVRTHEEHRRRGLSSILGEMAMESWFEDYANRILVLHVTNPAAQRIYQRQGFVTLAGKVADEDKMPGEIMACSDGQKNEIRKLLKTRYADIRNDFSERKLLRSDIAAFTLLTASEGNMNINPGIPGMEDVCRAEDFFTMYFLKKSENFKLRGMFGKNGILKGIKIYSEKGKSSETYTPKLK